MACLQKKNRQPEIITIEELAGHGEEQLTTKMCEFAIAQLITVYFDLDLNPTFEINRCCVASTLTGCVRKYIKHMHNKDNDHPYQKYLRKDKFPACWPYMRQLC